MLKLQDSERLELSPQEKSMAQSILSHLYYFKDNGFSEAQIKNVLEKLLNEMGL